MWNAEAAEKKAEHARQNPGYRYKPRKSSEKKRRMTKKKAAALLAGSTAGTFPADTNVQREGGVHLNAHGNIEFPEGFFDVDDMESGATAATTSEVNSVSAVNLQVGQEATQGHALVTLSLLTAWLST